MEKKNKEIQQIVPILLVLVSLTPPPSALGPAAVVPVDTGHWHTGGAMGAGARVTVVLVGLFRPVIICTTEAGDFIFKNPAKYSRSHSKHPRLVEEQDRDLLVDFRDPCTATIIGVDDCSGP